MAKPIKITIKGSGEIGSDAPTVDDFLGQVRDFLSVLEGVEKAVSKDGESELIWRVTNAQMNSPICFELTPYSKDPAAFIGARAELVEQVVFEGMVAIKNGEQKPRFFNDEVMVKARRIHARVTQGLADTTLSFDPKIADTPIIIDADSARRVEASHKAALAEQPIPYRELGSIEGFVSKAELDGFGRAILRFRSRIDGREIKAVATGRAFQQLEKLRLSEVWQGVRVRVYGTISYRGLGIVEGLSATGIEVLDQTNLPSFDDIVDANFTGGLISEEYLAELRNA